MNPQLQTILQKAIQAFRARQFAVADAILEEALKADINSADTIFELGIAYAKANRFAEALAIFYRLQPYKNSDVRVPYNLGLIHSLQGEHQRALEAYDLALKIQPDDVETLINMGTTYIDIKNDALALEALENAIRIRSDIPEAWSNKGIALNNLNLYEESISAYNEALKLHPNYHEAWSNKSVPLNHLKRFLEASEACDKALSLKPDYAEGWSNKGVTLNELKRYDEAIMHFDKALSLKPDYAEGWSNKGVTLNELKRYDEAIMHFDKALSLKPDYAKAWANKAIALNDLKRYDEVIANYEKALSLNPYINWIFGELLHAKMKICSWSDLEDSVENISKLVMANEKVVSPFILLALSDDAALHKKCSEIYIQSKYPLNPILEGIDRSAKIEKIRIAYFSPDFRIHPVSLLTAELFEIHDRARFEIFAFSLQRAPIDDEMNLRLRSSFDRFIDAEHMSDLEIAKLSRELRVDIAIDLAGATEHSRTGIFSYRAAPIQVNWLGYPGTIGADFIDYIVADKTIIPESCQQFYSEKVVCLPNTYMVDDSRRIASTRVFKREEFGLSEDSFVFCCFNNGYKFNPQVLDSWSNILLRVKHSVLWISENNQSFKANIKAEFDGRGIDPSRIIFAQRLDLLEDHLARYALADLFLDTHPYNAHTTAVDSLKAGVPVLTLKGQSFASRVAASLLEAIGLPELITINRQDYESLAIELANNPHKLAAIKQKLLQNRQTAPLFDTPLFSKSIEAAYIEIFERYQRDIPLDHLSISSKGS